VSALFELFLDMSKPTMKRVLEEHKILPQVATDPWHRPILPPRQPPVMNEYGYPVQPIIKRPRQWVVRPVSFVLLQLANELLKMAHPNYMHDSAVTREFDSFCKLNHGFGPVDLLLFMFATDMLLQGLKASTVDTYVSGVLRCKEHARHKISGPYVKDIQKILEEIQCHEEVQHAKDIDMSMALRMLHLLDGPAQLVCFLMITCGARVSDLLDMTRSQFVFLESREVRISFRLTKNHRSRGNMYSIVVSVPQMFPSRSLVSCRSPHLRHW